MLCPIQSVLQTVPNQQSGLVASKDYHGRLVLIPPGNIHICVSTLLKKPLCLFPLIFPDSIIHNSAKYPFHPRLFTISSHRGLNLNFIQKYRLLHPVADEGGQFASKNIGPTPPLTFPEARVAKHVKGGVIE